MSILHVAIPQEQEHLLSQLASQEGQSLDALVEQLLREGIQRRQQARRQEIRDTAERLQALARIEEHRQAFLARRDQNPLDIEPAELLRQAREERDDHLLTVFQEPGHDRD